VISHQMFNDILTYFKPLSIPPLLSHLGEGILPGMPPCRGHCCGTWLL
jgi:hypothetical protein